MIKMGSKVLVTGGAGYIGSHAVRQLTEAGYEVTVLDDLSTGFKTSLVHGEKLVVGDIGDVSLLKEVFAEGYESVLHFAGSIIVSESTKNPVKYFKNNTLKTLLLAEQAVQSGVKSFIFSSTAAVYGFPEGGYAHEETKLQPCNPYGLSKLQSEQMLLELNKVYPFKLGILRYFNVAGADVLGRMGQSTPEATHLIKVACQTALGKRPFLEVFGTDYPTADGTCVRDYIHVEDLAKAHLDLLNYLPQTNEAQIFNAGYGHGYSVLEVIEKVKQVTGKVFEVKNSPRRDGDPATLVAKSEKIKKVLNWKPQFNHLDKIVEHAWQWEKTL